EPVKAEESVPAEEVAVEAETAPVSATETPVEAKEAPVVENKPKAVSQASSANVNAKTVITAGHASAPMAQPAPVADSETKHTSVAMAHDKRELIPDSGLRPGSVKPAGRASSAMTKTLSAE
ncbi:ribonuclease E, partial [Pseudoalteromonas sp. S3173]